MATVTGTVKDALGNTLGLCPIKFSPLRGPFTDGFSLISPQDRTLTTQINGTFSTSLAAGAYTVYVNEQPVGSLITVPSGTGTYDISALGVPGPVGVSGLLIKDNLGRTFQIIAIYDPNQGATTLTLNGPI